jgi:hypothetical protein
MDFATMMPILMYGMVIAMVGMLVMQLFKSFSGKKKKEVEIPRDTMERLTKAYRVMSRAGFNRRTVRHTLWISGDTYFQGYRMGDIVAVEPQNEEYFVFVKPRWWYFWKRAIPVHIDVELCTDWNCRDIVVEARGIEAVTEGEYYLIPTHGVKKGYLETAYIQRMKNRTVKVLKQSIMDADVDLDYIPKIALRGDINAAVSEVGRYEEMPTLSEDEVQRQQRKALRNDNNTNPGS